MKKGSDALSSAKIESESTKHENGTGGAQIEFGSAKPENGSGRP
jgi:hypothetical protein